MLDQDCSDHRWRQVYCVFCGHTIRAIVDCGRRFCPFCSYRRACRIRPILAHLLKSSKNVPGARIKMLTVSVANCSDLDAGVRHLIKSFRRLRQRSVWKRHVFGGAFVIEITGKPGNWHPHIHVIMHSYYFPWSLLRAAWFDVSGGAAVWIADVSDSKAKWYVTKYVTKPDVPAACLDVVSAALRRYRLFNRFGSWHNIALPRSLKVHPCPSCGRYDWMVDYEIDRRSKAG